VSAPYELLSVSVEKEFRLDPEMRDSVLSSTQSCPAERKGPENDGPGVREPFGCIGSLCAPVRSRYDVLCPIALQDDVDCSGLLLFPVQIGKSNQKIEIHGGGVVRLHRFLMCPC
jgi:hypothetical protein